MGIFSALVRLVKHYPDWQEDKKIGKELSTGPFVRINKFGIKTDDVLVSYLTSVFDINTFTDKDCKQIAPEDSKVFNKAYNSDDLRFLLFQEDRLVIYCIETEKEGYKIIDKQLHILLEIPFSTIKNCELIKKKGGWRFFNFNFNRSIEINNLFITAFFYIPPIHISKKQQKKRLKSLCDKFGIIRLNF